MLSKAKLVRSAGGLVPTPGNGWFVVNAKKVRWFQNEKFGQSCNFEGSPGFPHLGINLTVVWPGQPACMYHGESEQEDFLVLSGTCLVLIEEQEIRLKAWDFVHCPPWTDHVFVGAGKGPCVILMVGARRPKGSIVYPVSKLARKHEAGVAKRTPKPREAYADCPRWKPLKGKPPIR